MEGLRHEYSQTEHVYHKVKSVLNHRDLHNHLQTGLEEISFVDIFNTVGLYKLA